MRGFTQINLSQFEVRSRGERSRLQQGDDSQISSFYILILILYVKFGNGTSDSINEGKTDMHVLLEKQGSQFRALTEALKDSLNNLGFALDNSVSKLSKSIDKKIDKLNSVYTSGQLEDLNRERQETSTPSSDLNGKRRVGFASYQAIQAKRE